MMVNPKITPLIHLIGIKNLRKEYGSDASFPIIRLDLKSGNRYDIEFMIDQRECDLFSVFGAALHTLQEQKKNSDFHILWMKAIQEEDVVAIILEFEENIEDHINLKMTNGMLMIAGENSIKYPNFKLILQKEGHVTETDTNAVLAAYKEANRPNNFIRKRKQFILDTQIMRLKDAEGDEITQAKKKLTEMGVSLFLPDSKAHDLDWDYLAGYENQKRDIEDTVLLALQHPQIYDQITKGTRMKEEPNRPKAVLFEGPPGTGKTTSAKIIAQQVNIPLVYMPIESIMSKWFGEAEKRFAEVFDSCKVLGKCIIFIDEIDAIASSRDQDLHETSRRILSTLLRKIDSFESTTDVLLICATNRKKDLDAAVLSRIDLSIKFEMPDRMSRVAIFQRYAKQLSKDQLQALAGKSEGLSGRNINDICKDAERRWASKMIRKEVSGKLPTIEQYMESLENRKNQSLA